MDPAVGVDLMFAKLIGNIFGRAHETVARVAHHDLDASERRPRAIDHAMDRLRVGEIEFGHPQPIAVFGFQCATVEASRTVPATSSPLANNCWAITRRNPVLIPVINQRFFVISRPRFNSGNTGARLRRRWTKSHLPDKTGRTPPL